MARFFNISLAYAKSSPSPSILIDNIDDFFKQAQQLTGQFVQSSTTKNGITSYTPYTLLPKQKAWLRLFDKDIPNKRRALLASRDKGKSQIVSILGSAWALYKDPSRKIAIMSFKYENAAKIVHNILQILQAFGMVLHKRNGGFYTNFNQDHTPSLMAFGLLSTVRMLHFDDLIMDDPLTVKEQFSKKYIQRAYHFINEGGSIAQRIILIGQLLTREDLYYEAFANVHEVYYLMQSWHGDIPELDKDIEMLKKTNGIKDVARNYLGYIEDKEERIFSEINIDKTPLKKENKLYAYIDPSYKGIDYTAVAIGWFEGGRIIVYGEIFKEDWGHALEKIMPLISSCEFVYFERNGGLIPMGRMIKKATGCRVLGINSSGNKIAKIYSIKPYISQDKVRIHENMPENAKNQIINWSELAPHDDMPDAMSMLVLKMLEKERKYEKL